MAPPTRRRPPRRPPSRPRRHGALPSLGSRRFTNGAAAQAFLQQVGERFSASLDYSQTLENIFDAVIPALGDFGLLDVARGEGPPQRVVRAVGNARRRAVLEQLRWPLLVEAGSGVIHAHVTDKWLTERAENPQQLAFLRALAFRSVISIPLCSPTQTVGTLTLFHGESGRNHAHAELGLLEKLGKRAAIALEHAELLKEAQEAVIRRDEFLSIASHELRTPLTTMELQVKSLLRAGSAAAEEGLLRVSVAKVERLDRQLQRLGTLVTTLLDVAQRGRLPLDLSLSVCDVSSLLVHSVARLQAEAERAKCQVTLESEPGVEATLDERRVDQVVSALVSNALKYGAGKPVGVTLRRRGPGIRISVADQGIGIADKDSELIFGRFGRATSVRHYGGLGLSLWLSREIAWAHGGALGFESEPGAGARFHLDLPKHPPCEGATRMR